MNQRKQSGIDYLLILLFPILGMALGVGVVLLFGIGEADYGNLIVNLFFLTGCLSLLLIFKFSQEDLGLKIISAKLGWHFLISLVIFSFYMLFYIFVIQISGFRPFSTATVWGLLNYFVVVVAEELYFRGMLYRFVEKRFTARTALVVTSLLFGLFHARQGVRGIISKTFTGWLWGSVRYSSGMIFLLIFPVHFVYNSIWLLFEGNWTNPPGWVVYIVPALEFLFGLGIVTIHNRRNASKKN